MSYFFSYMIPYNSICLGLSDIIQQDDQNQITLQCQMEECDTGTQ